MTMTDNEKHEDEAREQLASRIATMREYLDLAERGVDVYDDLPEDVYPLNEWGLEWAKDTTNHRDGTVTYVHVLSTGGPHDEFQVTFDSDDGRVTSWTFVYLPWFGRVELSYSPDENGTVREFYETFYGEYVSMEDQEP
jgi:hypothetical protein